MVELGMPGGGVGVGVGVGVGGGDNFTLQSSSMNNNSQLPVKEAATTNYHPYPPPLTTYEDVVSSRENFMDTLKKLHAAMGTKFMIPIVGGRDLDLFHLFVEVTSRGGISKVMKEKKWKEVTAVFSFPSSATNASFILRKYYISLLYHYEQIYYFKAKCWTPSSTDGLQHVSTVTSPPQGSAERMISGPQQAYANATLPQQRANAAVSKPEVSVAPAAGSPVCGVIDGKFEGGYLITVKIGSEDFKGVLYQVPSNEALIFPNNHSLHQMQRIPVNTMNHALGKNGLPRRKRRKKSEIRKRDPAHPKPNRSGYNFFFAEQHARLKPLYRGRDREISRMIGELWNKLQEPERVVYQEKALKDKERYKLEMEDYRERLKTGQVVRNAVPIQQCPPLVQDAKSTDFDVDLHFEGVVSAHTEPEENGTSSDKSDKSNMEDSDFGEYSQADTELKNVDIEILADEKAFELQTGLDQLNDKNPGNGQLDDKKSLVSSEENCAVLAEDGISVPIEEKELMSSTAN